MKEIIHATREGVCGMEKPIKALSVVIIAVMLALVLAVTAPAAAWADDSSTGTASTPISGDCSAAGDGSVIWELTQNNDDSVNPTYTLAIKGSGAMTDWYEHRATGNNSCGTDVSSDTCENQKCEKNRPWASYLDSITQITISDSVTRLGSECFVGARKVESITLPASLETIGFGSLASMKSLKEISIPDSVKSIETSALYGDSALTELSFSDKGNLESIGDYSFSGLGVSGEVDLPEGLKTVGICLFENCDKIEKLVIPASVEAYATTASGYNALFNKSQNSSEASLKEVVIKSSADLPNYMFSNVNSLEKLEITGNVNAIGNFAFNQCTNLSSVLLGSGVKEIGEHAFQYATSLTEINLSSVETIKAWAFANSGLTSVDAFSVSKIGSSAFYKCLDLMEVKNALKLETIESGAFQEDSALTNINLSSAKTIGSQAFNKAGLSSIDLSSIEEINSEAFRECQNLVSVSGLGSAKKIGDFAFCSDAALVNIDLSSVESIGNQAFNGTGIESAHLLSANQVGSFAFANCGRLKSLTFVGSPTIGSNVLGSNPSLTTVNLTGVISFDGINSDAFTYWEQSRQLTAFYLSGDIAFDGNRPALRKSGSRSIFASTNGGTVDEAVTSKGVLASPVREGYIFAGWYKDQNFTSEYINGVVESNADNSGDWTQYYAYAKWNSEITFDANGGTGSMDKQAIAEGGTANLTANTFTRTDSVGSYEFTGWNTKADGTGVAYADGAEIMSAGNMTLYAQWAKVDTYSVSAIPDQTYTGLPIEPTVVVKNGNDTISSSQYIVEYTDNTNVGTATARVTVNPNTADKKEFRLDFSIVKDENPSVEVTVPSNWVYGDTGKAVTAIAKTSAENQITDVDVSIKYYSNQACTENETSTLPSGAGTFWAKATLPETSNHVGKESEEVEVTIAKAIPAVDFGIVDNSLSKTYGDADFTQSVTVTTSDVDSSAFDISYKSSNESVATVNENGTVHIISAGTTTIIATATPLGAHAGNYEPANATYVLTVNPAGSITEPSGDGTTQDNPLKTTYGKTVTFAVAITQQPVSDVATQDAGIGGGNTEEPGENKVGFYYNGNLLGNFVNYDATNGTATFEYDTASQLIPAGSVQIVDVKFGGSDNLNSSEGKLYIEIAKAPQNLTFEKTTITQHVGSVVNALSGAEVQPSYSSSDTSVATVGADGAVTIVAPGKITITATAQETDWFNAATASYALTVSEHALGSYIYDNTNPEKGHWQECAECDYVTNTEAHQFGDWTVTKQASATEPGERTHTCNVCGYTVTETIAANGKVNTDNGNANNENSTTTTTSTTSTTTTKTGMAATGDNTTGAVVVIAVVGLIAFGGAVYAFRRRNN